MNLCNYEDGDFRSEAMEIKVGSRNIMEPILESGFVFKLFCRD